MQLMKQCVQCCRYTRDEQQQHLVGSLHEDVAAAGGDSFRNGCSTVTRSFGERRTNAAAAQFAQQLYQLVAKAHPDEGVEERVEAAVREAQAPGHVHGCLRDDVMPAGVVFDQLQFPQSVYE